MYYRIMTSPPGYGPSDAFMVGIYYGLDIKTKTCNLEKPNGRPFFATLEEARSMLPSSAQRYLTSVLAKIGQTPREELAQFLPDLWKREDAAEPMTG